MKRNYEYHIHRSRYNLGNTDGGNYRKYVLLAFGISATWFVLFLIYILK